jgi:hypothetical protein
MDAARFDRMTRWLSAAAPRRGFLAGLSAAVGLAAIGIPASVQAKNKKKKKLKKNEFGCVDVGKACRGKDANCCSNICQGKKPKKGKKDKSKCVAHNVLDCAPGADTCSGGGTVSCGNLGVCHQTTGKASFCGNSSNSQCFDCKKDVDCEPDFEPGAACIVCASCPGPGTACVEAGT